MENYAGKERRIVNIVTQHWSDIKGSDREWPERHEIDTAEIMESWQHCFIIEVKERVVLSLKLLVVEPSCSHMTAARIGLARPGKDHPLTENRRAVTNLLWLCSVGE